MGRNGSNVSSAVLLPADCTAPAAKRRFCRYRNDAECGYHGYRGCLEQERGTGEERSNTSDPGRCERSFLHAHDDPSFEPAIVQLSRWDRFYKGMKH